MANSSIFLFNKPFGVQSQFRPDENNTHETLQAYFNDKNLRIAGRLDANSEGLLVLTGSSPLDGKINAAITQPPKSNRYKKQGKTYLVQVEGIPSALHLDQLRSGVVLKDGRTLPAEINVVLESELPISLWQRHPPIRQRQNIPTSWLSLTIYEGKNRQVRRMTAHVGLPCLRLIRWSVAGFELGNISVGESVKVELDANQLEKLGLSR